jgi:hypothetical protein
MPSGDNVSIERQGRTNGSVAGNLIIVCEAAEEDNLVLGEVGVCQGVIALAASTMQRKEPPIPKR